MATIASFPQAFLTPVKGDSQAIVTTRPLTPPQDETFTVHTIDDVLIERCRTIPNVPLVGYPSSSQTAENYTYYTAKDLSNFADGAVDDLLQQGFKQVRNVTRLC